MSKAKPMVKPFADGVPPAWRAARGIPHSPLPLRAARLFLKLLAGLLPFAALTGLCAWALHWIAVHVIAV